jgi:hypothetical protein
MNSKNQIDKLKGNLKKRNYKAFFFFIGFTLLIWLFVQMSKIYQHDIEVNFHLKNTPESLVIESTEQILKAQVEQSGFKILGIHLFNSTIDIDFNELDTTTNVFQYDLLKNKSEIARSLKISNKDLTIKEDVLIFEHYVLSTKKLKIKSNFKVSFSKGYDSLADFRFEPSQIEVSGNDSILNKLEYISTQDISFENVSDTISGRVEIQKVDSLPVNYLTDNINYFLPVAKFTEGVFEIPIEFEDSELNDQLIIFPKTVKVNFKTSLSNYERIDESGFKVIAKYKPNDKFMLLDLIKQPKYVKNASLENYKVDYLIKK